MSLVETMCDIRVSLRQNMCKCVLLCKLYIALLCEWGLNNLCFLAGENRKNIFIYKCIKHMKKGFFILS